MKQTLAVLRRAPVPWSSTIISLSETSSNFDHELSFEIKIECEYVPIKLILKKYGYATIGVNNVSMNHIALCFYEIFMYCILTNYLFLEINITDNKRKS